MTGVEQHRLSHGHERIGEIDLGLAGFGNRHAAENNVEASQLEGRNDAGPQGVDEHRLDPQRVCHLYADVDVKAHQAQLSAPPLPQSAVPDLFLAQSAACVDHLKGHIACLQADAQFAALDDAFQGGILGERDIGGQGRYAPQTCH